ncbi:MULTISPECIES: glycine zipper 2TM domain-containing protein [unclassified Halomonas]|uniref:glycine zipper 2TM domain-containing protein n=1 Tax=unclassified Halomonas TaxID=2609666 RepID=UPI0021E410D2|nr:MULTISPECIES: glycine zipper 2TM domain-containing protein [unclassified Halomonas]UYG00961.1 glycine zipper 2TM domain-containing protein [Halomonas sp. GD1P12]WNL37977.1 glycine zipper 2TM domain-containing protein [Halomonas sp. PAMB 3232]WNL41299.1 glycine zipper 2TM domain-containing protein [Halomonas sp. PAMB 3264]
MKRLLPVAALSLLTLAGCANTAPYSGDVYRGNQAQTGQSVSYGTIVAIRPVQIQADSRAGGLLGTGGGAIIGGLLGSQVGGGSGRQLATVAGALGGSVAGSSIEDRANRVRALEMEIRRDDGSDVVVVQRADRQFQAGQRVRLIGSGGNLSVAPY